MGVRMDNVGIVVDDLDVAVDFFTELGLVLDGRATIDGDWSGRVTGLPGQRVEIAMMVAPDGSGKLELSRFIEPHVVADHRRAPVNALGYLRVMFEVDGLDDVLERLARRGAEVVDDVVRFENVYRLCYVRGPEGILLGLAESIVPPAPRLRLLQIGIDPAVVDFSPWPGQTADGLRARIDAAVAALEADGLDVTVCLVPDDATGADDAVRAAVAAGSFDVVEIGSGLRTSHEYTAVFERVIGAVVAGAPGVPMCFNDSPETTLDAVRRVVGR